MRAQLGGASPTNPPPCSAAALPRTNVFVHHGGSPLRLVGLLLACAHYIWSPIYLLATGLSHAWCCVALPLLALLPVRARGVCDLLAAGAAVCIGLVSCMRKL